MSKCLHIKYPLFLSDFNENRIFLTDFQKISNIKFNQNPSSGSRVVACGQMDVTNLIVAFRNFANAPTNGFSVWFDGRIGMAKQTKGRRLRFAQKSAPS